MTREKQQKLPAGVAGSPGSLETDPGSDAKAKDERAANRGPLCIWDTGRSPGIRRISIFSIIYIMRVLGAL